MKYPATHEGFLAWLEKQKPQTQYNFFSPKDCLIGRFLTDVTEKNDPPVSGSAWPTLVTGIPREDDDLSVHLKVIREYHRIGYVEKQDQRGKTSYVGMTYGEALNRVRGVA